MTKLAFPFVYAFLWLEAAWRAFPDCHHYAKHQAPVLLRRRLK